MFDLTHLKQHRSIGTVIHQAEMSSTSDIAKETLTKSRMKISLPMLVLCDQQTAGRGQPGKSWQSSQDSLTFTWCIASDSVPPAQRPLLPLIAGVCVCNALQSAGIENPKLKWPNDVLIDRKKVSGILVEQVASSSLSWFLVGIGINVNQTEDDLVVLDTAASAIQPSSLRQHTGVRLDLQSLLIRIVDQLKEAVVDHPKFTPEDFATRLEFLNEDIEFQLPNGQRINGEFRGVDMAGRIQIAHDGDVRAYSSGQLIPHR